MDEYKIEVGLALSSNATSDLKTQIENQIKKINTIAPVQVNIDTSNLNTQIKKVNSALTSNVKPLNIQIGTNTSNLNTQITKVNNNLQNSINPLNLQVNTQQATSSVDSFVQKLESLKERVGSGQLFRYFNTDFIIADVQEAERVLRTLGSDMKSLYSDLIKMSSSPQNNSAKLSTTITQLEEVLRLYQKIRNAYTSTEPGEGFASTTQLDLNLTEIQRKIWSIKADLSDVSALKAQQAEVKDINTSFKELLSVTKEMKNIRIGLVKETNSENIAEMTNRLEQLNAVQAELENRVSGRIDTSKWVEYERLVESIDVDVERLQNQLSDTRYATILNRMNQDVNNGFKQMKSNLEATAKAMSNLVNAKANGLPTDVKLATDRVKELRSEYYELSNQFKSRFDTTQLKIIEELQHKIATAVVDTKSKLSDVSALKAQQEAYNRILQIQKEISALNKTYQSSKDKGYTKDIENQKTALRELNTEYKELMKNNANSFSSEQMSNIANGWNRVQQNVKSYKDHIADVSAEKKANEELKETESILREIGKLESKSSNYIIKAQNARNKGNIALAETYERLSNKMSKQSDSLWIQYSDSFTQKQDNKYDDIINTDVATLNDKLLVLQSTYRETQKELSQKIESGFPKMETDLVKLESKFKSISNAPVDLKNSVKELRVSFDELRDTSDIDKRIAAFEKYEQEFTEVQQSLNRLNIAEKDVNKTAKEIVSTIKQITDKRIELFQSTDIEKSKRLQAELDALVKKKNELYKGLFSGITSNESANAVYNRIWSDTASQRAKIKELANEYKTSFDKMNTDIIQVESNMRELGNVPTEISEKLTTLRNDFDGIKNSSNPETIISGYEKCKAVLSEVEQEVKRLTIAQKEEQAQAKLEDKRATLYQKMELWLAKNSAATKQFGGEIRNLQSQINEADNAKLNHLSAEFERVKSQAQQAGKATLSFTDMLKQKFKQLATYYSSAMIISKIIQGIRSIYTNVVELDKAMTGLYRVTDLSTASYEKLYEKMTKSAKEYGATLTNIIDATTEWTKLGFSPDVASGLSEITAMYQHVTDLDAETATKNLVTAYKGFEQELLALNNGDSVKSMEMITDVYDILGNKFAESAKEVGDGLAKAASVLAEGGNSFQESAALFTGIQEVIQDSGTAGNTLKILSLRLRGMKGQLEELGEEVDDNVESVSKMQTQILNLTGGKVNIFNADKTFKSTYQIMKEISSVYAELDDISQAHLLETIAGKQRSSGVAALIRNFDDVEKSLESATNAAGTAAEEQAKYLDSMEGHVNQLKASWQAFSKEALNSEFVKFIIDSGTDIIEIFNTLIDKIGTLPTVLATVYTAFSLQGAGELINQFR